MTTAPPGEASPATADAAGRAPARPAARRGRPGRRRASLRMGLEILFFVGPALILFGVFVVWPIARAVQFSLYRWKGFGPLVDFVGLQNYVVGADERGLHRRVPAQHDHRRAVDPRAAAAGPGDRAAPQPQDALPGDAAHDHLRAVRALRGDRRRRVAPAAAARVRRHRHGARRGRHLRSRAGLARHPRGGPLHGLRRADLEVPGPGRAALPRRAPGRAGRAGRGGPDRRRLVVAGPAPGHGAPARARPSAPGGSCR